MAKDFPLRLLLLGPHDTGKSAVAAQVLYKWGGLGPRMTQMLRKQVEQRHVSNTQLLAFLQRDRPTTPKRHYESPRYEVSIATSATCCFFPFKSQATCVLLLASAAQGDFEASWRLLKQQISFACRLHVQQLVVCVNKMDATHPPYNGQRYESIVSKISVHLQAMGRSPNDVVFLPISATCGDNMQGASLEMPWFGGWEVREEAGGTLQGRTLRQLLDAIFLNDKLDSYYTVGVWSAQEEKNLLLAWKVLASPASSTPPCPHVLSTMLMHAGVRRSPEQCRSKANSLLNGHIAARLQRREGPGPLWDELQAVLDCEAAQCVRQVGKMEPRLQGPTGGACGASQAWGPLEEDEPATAGPSLLRERLLAGEALGMENGPDVCSERPQRSPEGRGDLPALRVPSGRRDQDPDVLLTGLEIQPCKRIAWQTGGQTEPGAEEGAESGGGYRCVVYRRAYFAMKRKQQPGTAVRPQPRLEGPKPLLAAPPLPPPQAQSLPLLPTPEAGQLVLSPVGPPSLCPYPLQLPLPLAEPLLPMDDLGLAFPVAHPVPAFVPLQLAPVGLCYAPSGSANALPWQCQQAPVYAPLELVGHWAPSHLGPEDLWDQAPLGDKPSPAQPGPLLPPVSPWEPEWSPDLPPAADGPESSSSGTSASPLLPQAPRGSSLGLSAATLLSSLARLDRGEELQVACPPGTLLQPLSPPLSADSGAPPSPQLQGLPSSRGLPSPPWPQQLCLADPSQQQLPSPLPRPLPPSSPPGSAKTTSSTRHFLNCFLAVAFFFCWSLLACFERWRGGREKRVFL